MKSYILFDDHKTDLLPLTYTRPVAEIRIGILTIREKWELYLSEKTSYKTDEYLSVKFPMRLDTDNVFINATVLPDKVLLEAIGKLNLGEYLVKDNVILAARLTQLQAENFTNNITKVAKAIHFSANIIRIQYLYQIFSYNGVAIEADFNLLVKNRKGEPIRSTNGVINAENIFIEEGAIVEFSTLNASSGPIYIGKHAEIMEGCHIRGPVALGEHAQLKMGARIYGATTIGPNCKIGGEVQNCVIFGNTNKAHDGYLGNSVLGEWCNLGADTNNSNLKNNYSEVKLWNYTHERFLSTGLQFCGLIMADHSKCGINTMFNTGTVVGVSANIFGAGYPRNFIPSFSWGGHDGLMVYPLNKAIETAEKVLLRRNQVFSENDKKIFEYIFSITAKYRNNFK